MEPISNNVYVTPASCIENIFYMNIINNSAILHRYPAKVGYVLLYSPDLFGKKLFSKTNLLVNSKQTHFLKQNHSAIITPISKRCQMLINL